MWWRVEKGGKTWEEAKGARNRERLRRLVRAGKVNAVIAFAGDEPVGWCSFGPRRTFPRLERSRVLDRPHGDDTWGIVCFFIPAAWRGRGVATALLVEATKVALARGAREVEGYPVVPTETGGRIPAAFAWTGVPALFEEAGYEQSPRPGATRPIYVRSKR